MAIVQKIDSNVVGFRFAEETSLKVLPGSPFFFPLEPNSFNDFGGQVTTVARNPINADRQNLRGSLTDLDASGGFNSDLTQDKRVQKLMQGFFFADFRLKNEFGNTAENGTGVVTTVNGANGYTAASGLTVFPVGALVFSSGFGTSNNNGIKRVITSTATVLTVAETLVAEASPPTTALLVRAGVQAGSADCNVDVSGAFPAITNTTLDFTTLGLIQGEWIFVGGDLTAEKFLNAANNGFRRIHLIAAHRLEFDKSSTTMVTETGTGITLRLFFGRVLKNELASASLIKRRTYNLERTLGAPDDANPTQIQSEYITGAVPNEYSLNLSSADKATFDMSFVGCDSEQRTGVTGVKSGTRPALAGLSAYNTASDVRRSRLNIVTATANATPLFGFASEATITINNNASPNKAIGVLGAFEVTVGNFVVNGKLTVYFSDIAAISAIRANSDCTFDTILVKNNAGIAYDLPLVSLGDGRASIEQDQPITLPISMDASTAVGLTVSTSLNHTLLMVFFDYLPNAA